MGEPMIIEMRTYKIKSGKRAEFLEIFRTKSIPAHTEIGMKILGPFLSVEDPDTFFFMRGFPDLPSREPMKAKFYEGELWKRKLENLLMPMLEKYEVVLVDDLRGIGSLVALAARSTTAAFGHYPFRFRTLPAHGRTLSVRFRTLRINCPQGALRFSPYQKTKENQHETRTRGRSVSHVARCGSIGRRRRADHMAARRPYKFNEIAGCETGGR